MSDEAMNSAAELIGQQYKLLFSDRPLVIGSVKSLANMKRPSTMTLLQ
jgi:hypothetical protein